MIYVRKITSNIFPFRTLKFDLVLRSNRLQNEFERSDNNEPNKRFIKWSYGNLKDKYLSEAGYKRKIESHYIIRINEELIPH
jgi:hypothetical protein